MSEITILLADDHHVVRQGLRALLEAETDFRVVGEAATGPGATDSAERLHPDVLVLDVMMPGLNGLEVTRHVRQRSPRTRVIILSMHSNEAYVREALRHGAAGYVLKDSTATDLARAIREVAAGRLYLSSTLSDLAIAAYGRKSAEGRDDPYESLTAREREILHLAAEGLSTPEIAARLFISPRTVETHRANLLRKLDLRTQTDLVRFALRRGIIALQ